MAQSDLVKYPSLLDCLSEYFTKNETAHRSKSREWGRVKAKVEPLSTLRNRRDLCQVRAAVSDRTSERIAFLRSEFISQYTIKLS